MARLGLLGGTFNPPHLGHLICAQEAHDQLGLDHVELQPVMRLLREHEVADVGRVEGPAEDPYAQAATP